MIPLVDLKAQYRQIKTEIDQAIADVLESTQFVQGESVESFEQEFAQYCQAEYGIGVASGTAALNLTLRACNIGPDDEVITTPFTFISTVEVWFRSESSRLNPPLATGPLSEDSNPSFMSASVTRS